VGSVVCQPYETTIEEFDVLWEPVDLTD